MTAPVASAPSQGRTVLYDLARSGGTGIATYARTLAKSAARLGFNVDGIVDVERPLARGKDPLNDILAFDAIDETRFPSIPELVWRFLRYPFNALGGMRPVELPGSGMVVGPMADLHQSFRRVFAATRLVDSSSVHFSIYGRLVRLRLRDRPSIFHVTYPVPVTVKGCPNIYTIHDLVPLRLPHATLDNKRYIYRMLRALARNADHIVTVSEHSRRDIIEFLRVDERRVTNTYQALDIPPGMVTRSNDAIAADLAKLFGLDFGGYYLYCGAIEPKKNISRMVEAYAASETKLPLILAGGGGWQNRADLRKIRDERFTNFRIDGNIVRRERQVRRLEYLPREQLLTLMRGARALLFPSVYEGFGLPVIEAMALGTPVITSNVASLPEVAGDAALLVDPYSVDSIAWTIRAIEADSDLRQEMAVRGRLQASKFSPDAYDRRIQELYARF